jgi:hypothetical protein
LTSGSAPSAEIEERIKKKSKKEKKEKKKSKKEKKEKKEKSKSKRDKGRGPGDADSDSSDDEADNGGEYNTDDDVPTTTGGSGDPTDATAPWTGDGVEKEQKILDTPYSRRTSSSTYKDSSRGTAYGRGKLDSAQGWSAKTKKGTEWYELDLGGWTEVVGVRIQGRAAGGGSYSDHHVTAFSAYLDGTSIKYFSGLGGKGEDCLFDSPVTGRKLRLTNFKVKGHLSMRVDAIANIPVKSADGVMDQGPDVILNGDDGDDNGDGDGDGDGSGDGDDNASLEMTGAISLGFNETVEAAQETHAQEQLREIALSRVPICTFFNTPGGCGKGSACRFQHVEGQSAAWRRPCGFFNSAKGCSKAEACRFAHVKGSAAATMSEQAAKPKPKKTKGGADVGYSGGGGGGPNESSASLDQAEKVFVSGLPFSSTEQSVHDIFSSCGKILKVKLLAFANDRSKDGPQKCNGQCFITFGSVTAASAALALDRSSYEGRWLGVAPAKKRRAGAGKMRAAAAEARSE